MDAALRHGFYVHMSRTCTGSGCYGSMGGGGMLMFLEDATCSGCHTQWTPRYDMGSTCTCRSECYGTMGVEGCT